MTKDEAIKKIDGLVDDLVTLYKTDWTVHDRPRAEKCREIDSFMVSIRDTGIDTLFITGPCKSYSNQNWFAASLAQEREGVVCFYYSGHKKTFRRVSHSEAERICKKSEDMLSQEYIACCVERAADGFAALTEFEWEKERGETAC